jgi:hypothetical protein
MLVQAGADLNARVATGPDEGASVIMHLLKASWRETPSSKEESKEILQILIGEAGEGATAVVQVAAPGQHDTV